MPYYVCSEHYAGNREKKVHRLIQPNIYSELEHGATGQRFNQRKILPEHRVAG